MRAFGTVLALLATAGLALAQTAADPAVDCSAPDCNEVLAETCYAAGMQSNMASIITCVTMPGESQAAALKKVGILLDLDLQCRGLNWL